MTTSGKTAGKVVIFAILVPLLIVALIMGGWWIFFIVALSQPPTVGTQTSMEYLQEMMQEDWQIELSDRAKVAYYRSNFSWPGDGEVYFVLEYEDAPAGLLPSFSEGTNEALRSSIEDGIARFEDAMGAEVPVDMRPSFGDDCIWRMEEDEKSNGLYMVYDLSQNICYAYIFYI